MKDPDKLREALTRVAGEREAADAAHKQATAELRRLLRDVQGVDGLTMREAARLAGVSHVTAYELVKPDT